MTKTPIVLFALCTGASLAVLTVVGAGAWGLGGLLGTGETLYVQLVGSDDLGVVTGLATKQSRGPFGLGSSATTELASGWVVVVPEGQALPGAAPVEVTDDLAFTDPNGSTWLAREVRYGGLVAWVVPIGHTTYDATLDAEYNWALVVDWDKVPAGSSVVASLVPSLALR
jgi:hypothetical protein